MSITDGKAYAWKSFEGARLVRRKLYLKENDVGIFVCLHSGFKSKRGCRCHIETKNLWYFWLDTMPMVKVDVIMAARQTVNPGVHSKKQPSFSIKVGVGRDFKHWLHTQCGGGNSAREAAQSAKRAMNF